MHYEQNINGYLFSNDKVKLQTEVIHDYLSKESYWAENIPETTVIAAIQGSVCFGIYDRGAQIGFARVVTDHASFGYMADVFILKEYRGKGLSKQLIKFIMEYPPFKTFRRFMLATRDAHKLYEKFGFKPLSTPERFMEIKPFEKYPD
jgi:GNAT superfamily N-acetyltransferase